MAGVEEVLLPRSTARVSDGHSRTTYLSRAEAKKPTHYPITTAKDALGLNYLELSSHFRGSMEARESATQYVAAYCNAASSLQTPVVQPG